MFDNELFDSGMFSCEHSRSEQSTDIIDGSFNRTS